jgi:DNA mismatch repair protein MutH
MPRPTNGRSEARSVRTADPGLSLKERRRLLKISRLLSAKYSDYAHNNKRDPYRELVFILCSTMTRQAVHERVYRQFIRRFPTLRSVAEARTPSLAAALKGGGLEKRKSAQLRAVARKVHAMTGAHSLAFLKQHSDDAVEAFLTSLPGVGKKVARCVMLYALDRQVFPVDTHCWRVATRLGLLGRKSGPKGDRVMDRLQARIPPRLRYNLHVNLVSLGREVCIAGRPRCSACCLSGVCPTSSVRELEARESREMEHLPKDFDSTDKHSIAAYAKRLEQRTLAELVSDAIRDQPPRAGKGAFGNLVEELLFGVTPNNRDEPDLPEAGVEIKTSPLVASSKNRLVPKERLVLGMIDYSQLHDEEFESSKFLLKNRCLLLLFYLWEKGVEPFDYEILRTLLHEFPEEDLKIVRQDWERIRQKVRDGLAHEISEGDTFYLGACTKGADSSILRAQPKSPISAKPRAFSLKPSYLRVMLDRPDNLVPIDLRAAKEGGFESQITEKLRRYEGWTEDRLRTALAPSINPKAKNRYRVLVNRMLDLPGDAAIEQFEKAGVVIKTVRQEPDGKIKEAMSFRNIRFPELTKDDDWEDSDFYDDISRRFLFCVFNRVHGAAGYGFLGAFFWSMPPADMEEAAEVWRSTRDRALAGRQDFPKSSETTVAHVRTKGRDSRDRTELPTGLALTRRCFWLNNAYVQRILRTHGY